MVQVVLLQLRANDTQTADDTGSSGANIRFTGNVVKVNPLTILAGNDALCPKNDAVGLLIGESGKTLGDFVFGEGLGCLHAP